MTADDRQHWISVRGAREHNLKNIDVRIPRNRLVAITGLSGSGKSTLAFDTIFAEGQRRYVESLSVYARQFLGQLDKPDVDSIDGLSPAIAVDQKSVSKNPRSTVGTLTEVYDFLRLLFARVGRPHCPHDRRPLERQTPQQMVDALLALPEGSRLLLLGPVLRERKGEHQSVLEDIRRAGFVRVRIDGRLHELDQPLVLEKHRPHTLEVVVDRVIIRAGQERSRLADSVEQALKIGHGMLQVQIIDGPELTFSEQYACPVHGPINLGALEPRDFSFNNPRGACPTCTGLGTVQEFDPELIIPDRSKSLADGAVAPWAEASRAQRQHYDDLLAALAEHLGFSLQTPLRELNPETIGVLLYGSNGEPLPLRNRKRNADAPVEAPFEGVIPELRRRLAEARDEESRARLEAYLMPRSCPACQGARLRPEVLAVTVLQHTIAELCALPIDNLLGLIQRLSADPTAVETSESLSEREVRIAVPILREVSARLGFLVDLGLHYLTLDRPVATLSGGESQRIRLATQIGAGLSGVLYILDEPSIGLHPRDHLKLVETLLRLRDLGNSVLVVEHNVELIHAADWVVDIGPGAGEHGGELIVSGPLQALLDEPRSITGDFLSGRRSIPTPAQRRRGNGRELRLIGARANNLKHVDLRLPLGCLICVSGVSGSGKSSLISDTLAPRLAQILHNAQQRPGPHDALYGAEYLDKLIVIDQSPIGRTPRSNPATSTKLFDPIRNLFAQLPEARARGYDASRFSFNLKGGRCDACNGEGLIQIEMQFLPDLYVPCEVCGGTRYNRETLEIRYRGKNIAEVLEMTVDQALQFFERVPALAEKLQTLSDVGLGYIRLGQPGTTLSGGETQRVKLAAELARRSTGRTLYILDEPTTGLHFADVQRLLQILQRLVDAGNTVLVIEHDLDVIRSADYLIDMGPGGGQAGGSIIASGTPEQVAMLAQSVTGQFLQRELQKY